MYNSKAYYKFTLQDALRLWHPRLSEMYRFCADLDLVLRRIEQGGESNLGVWQNSELILCCRRHDASNRSIHPLSSRQDRSTWNDKGLDEEFARSQFRRSQVRWIQVSSSPLLAVSLLLHKSHADDSCVAGCKFTSTRRNLASSNSKSSANRRETAPPPVGNPTTSSEPPSDIPSLTTKSCIPTSTDAQSKVSSHLPKLAIRSRAGSSRRR